MNTEKFLAIISGATELYYRLVLLVGPSGSGKTAMLERVGGDLQSDVINVNAVLSELLLDLTAKQRILHCSHLLDQITMAARSPVLLDNIELLFDGQLRQDPLRLLQQLARNRTIVAAWNGAVENDKLIYAEPGHPEYRSYDAKDLVIVKTTDEPG